ncbi:MAG: hypothetical protein DMG06_03520 [Acidobacteria bacterium]|nr:MAG: hypothetical protein DMG06_03520 [Acidobacteriota bacterium]
MTVFCSSSLVHISGILATDRQQRKCLLSILAWGILAWSLTGFAVVSLGAIAQKKEAPAPYWRLATDDTTIVVSVEGDRPILKTLSAKAVPHNWVSTPIREKLVDTIEVGGAPVATEWRFRGADLDSGRDQLTLRYSNSNPQLELQSIWRARRGRGPVEHWLTIANESGRTVTVGHQDSLVLDGLVLAPNELAQAWWINRGGGNASREGGTFTVDTNAEFAQDLVSNPVDGSSPVPWIAIQVGQAHGLYVGWEFSGIGRIHAKTISTKPTRLDLRVGNVPEFKTDLPPGETFLIPHAFVGCYKGDIDEGSYTLHCFVLDKLLPPLPKNQPYPTLAYNLYLDSGGNKAKEADVLRSAALCKELGFETFVPDAMWFPQAGDWRWDPARFPNGLRLIEQYVHENGMKLGLWVAWTQGGNSEDSGALNIFRHPDWFVQLFNREWKSDYLNWSTLLDLGYDPAKEWAKQETQRLVPEYKLDYFKHDYSPIEVKCVQTNHRHQHGVDVSYWSTVGYYEVQEALKQKFPDLVLEGCSGGGHIKDFGYIKRVHYIVTTDTLSSLPNRQSIYDSTFALPPAVLQAYTYENHYNKDSDRPLPYFWRSAMMGAWQIDPTNTSSWTAEERAGARHATEIYKSWIRPMLRDVKVHHILPRPDDYHWDGMFYWSPSLKRGTLYIFRPNNDEVFKRIRLKGLVGGKSYRVRSEDRSVAEGIRIGEELMNVGLKIKLPGKFTSDLIFVEETE